MKNARHNGHDRLSRRVHIEFSHPTARTIFVAGTFNKWQPSDTPMVAKGSGRWAADIALPPGSYEYRLVADGEWISDPTARKSVPNPFGSVNSVLEVPADSAERLLAQTSSAAK